MNKKPILSICIPTFNRADCLNKVLEKLIPVCSGNNIQIYISDNASPDQTESLSKKFAENHDFIHYHRHLENIGSDDNFEFVLKMADTKYRWLMSDTCYIDDVADMISDLESVDWDAYILNDPKSPMSRSRFLPKTRTVYDESISVMREIGWHLTWISCMVYNERLVNSLNFERYKNSSFNQTALVFETTANRPCKICFNPRVAVKNLPLRKDSGWHYHVFDIMYRQWYLLIMSMPLYYPYEIKKKCIEDNGKKPVVLNIINHLERRAKEKWTLSDLYRNRFFVKQAKANYYLLFLFGLCPCMLARILCVFHWAYYVIRYVAPQRMKCFYYERKRQ